MAWLCEIKIPRKNKLMSHGCRYHYSLQKGTGNLLGYCKIYWNENWTAKHELERPLHSGRKEARKGIK